MSSDALTPTESIILTLLFSPGKNKKAEPIRGKISVAKQIFILWKNPILSKRLDDIEFEPYDFGPWSDTIEVAIDELKARDLIKGTGTDPIIYSLTNKGKNDAMHLWNELSDQEKSIIIDVKRNLNSLTTKNLLRIIYSAYPEYAKESKYKF